MGTKLNFRSPARQVRYGSSGLEMAEGGGSLSLKKLPNLAAKGDWLRKAAVEQAACESRAFLQVETYPNVAISRAGNPAS